MRILKSDDYLEALKEVLTYIAKDKKSAAVQFNSELNKKIRSLKEFPYLYRQSRYFEDEQIRDLIHKGYSVPYEIAIDKELITIIGITKYKKSLR